MAREAGKKRETGNRAGRGSAAESAARREVLDTARAMSRQGLSPGRSGNVSARFVEDVLITPSGMAYDSITPADIVRVGLDGQVAADQRKPSSELHFHLATYRSRPDVGAIVHTHSLHATVLACARRAIPAFHYMVAVAGGDDIPLVPYATFGTDELARHVAAGLAQRNACLMANHGQIAVGPTCADALALATEVEMLAEQYVKVLTIGSPHILARDEMARMLELFAGYGQKGQD
ncbi:MAG: class II aldolase/adducin family protein [Hyphomicrobiaceae bacterium]